MSELPNFKKPTARVVHTCYKLPDYVSEYYKSFKVDERNGNESKELPLSATYVIGKDRVVMFAFLDADYRKRAELSDIEKALRGKGV